tara:strand:- start:29 stop:445 length:417 start_codon:yes stop_codon:yes gene_type:complete
MDATIWGPNLWFFLHTLSFEYPESPTKEDINGHYMFFKSLTEILPCKICRNHYTKFFNNNPIKNYLNKKTDLIKWVLKCHNNVNIKNNKKVWTYEMLIDKYTNIYKNPLYNVITYKNLSACLVIVVIILIIYIIFKKL